MYKFLSISFTFLLLMEAVMPNMDVCELKKLNGLLEHYQESNSSLTDFLALHYGLRPVKEHHKDGHDGHLPFQSSTCCQMHLFVSESLDFSCGSYLPEATRMYAIYTSPHSSAFPHSIFQPPKVA